MTQSELQRTTGRVNLKSASQNGLWKRRAYLWASARAQVRTQVGVRVFIQTRDQVWHRAQRGVYSQLKQYMWHQLRGKEIQ